MSSFNTILESDEVQEIITRAIASHETSYYTKIDFGFNKSSGFSVLIDKAGFIWANIPLAKNMENVFGDLVSDYKNLPIYVLVDNDYYGTPSDDPQKDQIHEIDPSYHNSMYPVLDGARKEGDDLFMFRILNTNILHYVEENFDILHIPYLSSRYQDPLFHDEYKVDSGLFGEDLLVSIDQW